MNTEKLKKGIETVAALMNESTGVGGLHLNGDFAPWDDLRTGGRYEGWLVDLDDALNEINTHAEAVEPDAPSYVKDLEEKIKVLEIIRLCKPFYLSHLLSCLPRL